MRDMAYDLPIGIPHRPRSVYMLLVQINNTRKIQPHGDRHYPEAEAIAAGA